MTHCGFADTHLRLSKQRLDNMLARYMVSLLDGYSIKKVRVNTNTIKGYLRAIHNYYIQNDAAAPYLDSPDSPVQRILDGQRRFEQLPERREPLHDLVLMRMHDLAMSAPPLGFAAAIWDITALGRLAGFRQQEYAMDSRTSAKYYVKPDGSKVLRAFSLNNFLFPDATGVLIQDPLSRQDDVMQIGTRYEVQKNGMNGQVIWFHRDSKYSEFCPVRVALRLLSRATTLGQSAADPLCVYQLPSGQKCFLTGTDVTEYYRWVTKLVFPHMLDEELRLISSHSLRVKACILLAEAGKSGYYIKLRLRWKSDCYEVYLRNTVTISSQHNTALEAANDVMRNFGLSDLSALPIIDVDDLAAQLETYALDDED